MDKGEYKQAMDKGEYKQASIALMMWLESQGIRMVDAVPLLALTIAAMLVEATKKHPQREHAVVGGQIVYGMIRRAMDEMIEGEKK